MLKALGNVAGRHLLDRRLDPPVDLQPDVIVRLSQMPLVT